MGISDKADYELVVIGASAGGLQVLKTLLTGLPVDFSLPIAVVQHVAASSDGSWALLLDAHCELTVKEADEKERVTAGTVYVAPPNYHLLLEPDLTFTLTVDEAVNYARPAIDVLFETAAEAVGPRLIGIVMTGANSDGAKGLRHIRDKGGLALVQDPQTAEARAMPEAAILLAQPQHILSPLGIQEFLLDIHNNNKHGASR